MVTKKKANRKKRKKKPPKTIVVDVTDLYRNYKVPRNMRLWSSDDPISKKCEDMISECTTLIAYITKCLNEGPEVKTNIMKRTSILKSLTQFLLRQTFLDDFHRLGILDQIAHDLKAKQGQRLLIVDEKSAPKNDKKSKGYVS